MASKTCSKCGGRMGEGFLLDHTHGGYRDTQWVEGPPVTLAADPDQLGAAAGNLLSNAIRFSPPGGTVRLEVAVRPDRVCIDVRDQGPGISETDRARVFEPFYRGERQPEEKAGRILASKLPIARDRQGSRPCHLQVAVAGCRRFRTTTRRSPVR